jgi:hypothetical protein
MCLHGSYANRSGRGGKGAVALTIAFYSGTVVWGTVDVAAPCGR